MVANLRLTSVLCHRRLRRFDWLVVCMLFNDVASSLYLNALFAVKDINPCRGFARGTNCGSNSPFMRQKRLSNPRFSPIMITYWYNHNYRHRLLRFILYTICLPQSPIRTRNDNLHQELVAYADATSKDRHLDHTIRVTSSDFGLMTSQCWPSEGWDLTVDSRTYCQHQHA